MNLTLAYGAMSMSRGYGIIKSILGLWSDECELVLNNVKCELLLWNDECESSMIMELWVVFIFKMMNVS